MKLILKCILVLLIASSFIVPFKAHSSNIDSLKKLLNSQDNTFKADVLYQLSLKHAFSNPDTAIYYAKSLVRLGRRQKDSLQVASAYNLMGIAGVYGGSYAEALLHLNHAEKILDHPIKNILSSDTLKLKERKASVMNTKGMVYKRMGEFDTALEYYFKALRLDELLKDSNDIATVMNNIGNVFFFRQEYDKALHYYLEAKKISEKIRFDQELRSALNNLGMIYGSRGILDTAALYFQKYVVLCKRTGDMRGQSAGLTNLGHVYGLLKDYERAVESQLNAMKVAQKMGNKSSLVISLINISSSYLNLGRIKSALKYGLKANKLARQIGAKRLIRDSYKVLAEVHAGNSDFKSAYEFCLKFIAIHDTIFNEKSQQKVAEMQAKYEAEKKEKQIALLNKEKEEQKQREFKFRTYLVGGFIVFLVIVIFVYYRMKLRHNKILLQRQKENTRSIINIQEKERARIAKDLHDGIGQKLAGVKINMERLNEKLQDSNKEIFLHSIGALDDTCTELRTISHQMMPRVLKDAGLIEGIHELLDKTLRNSGIKYNFEVHQITELPEELELGMYRSVQELLNNILKHAGATEISIQLLNNKNKFLVLIFEDNGKGIDHLYTKNGGMGLQNIKSRVQAMNGIFSIDRGPEKGTVANIRVPLI